MFVKLQFFKKYPEKDFYGEHCPLKIWSIEIEEEQLLPINGIKQKISVTKAQANFEQITEVNNKRRKIRGSDKVMFVI